MKKSTRFAAAFLALAGLAGSTAFANDQHDRRSEQGQMRFDRTDADSSGGISFDEFAAAVNSRLGDADADGDGKMTVSEIATEIQRMRAERMAKRIIDRFDTDGDGVLTTAEVESRQKKRFALLDRNDDGMISKEEMPRHGFGGRHHRKR